MSAHDAHMDYPERPWNRDPRGTGPAPIPPSPKWLKVGAGVVGGLLVLGLFGGIVSEMTNDSAPSSYSTSQVYEQECYSLTSHEEDFLEALVDQQVVSYQILWEENCSEQQEFLALGANVAAWRSDGYDAGDPGIDYEIRQALMAQGMSEQQAWGFIRLSVLYWDRYYG